jgi:hypothetical protein
MINLPQGYYALRNGHWEPTIDPNVRILTNSDLIKTLEVIAYVDREGQMHAVPEAFVCDGGSKPNWSWVLFGHPLGRYLMAYIIHDYDYHTIREGVANSVIKTDEAIAMRRAADRLFLEGMRWIKQESGFGRVRNLWHRLKVRLKYNAVRGFAGHTIDKHTDSC